MMLRMQIYRLIARDMTGYTQRYEVILVEIQYPCVLSICNRAELNQWSILDALSILILISAAVMKPEPKVIAR